MHHSCALSEIAGVFSGGGAPQDREAFSEFGYPFVRAASLPKLLSGEAEDSLEKLTPDTAKQHRLRLFPAETVLFAKSGMSALKGHIYRLRGPAYVVNHLAALVPHNPADGRYLERVLRFRSPTRLVQDASYPSIRLPDIGRMEVPVPATEGERRRITDVLDGADTLRAKRRRVVNELEVLKRATFRDVISGFDGQSADVLLSDAFWFQEGPGVRKWQFRERGIKLLNVGNIKADGELELSKTGRHLDEAEVRRRYPHFLVDPGDFVIASSGISFDSDDLLRTRGAFVRPEHLPLCMNTSTIRFKSVEGVSDLRFLSVWLQSHEFRSQITRLVTGSAQQNFGPSHLRAMKISLPPLDVQREVAHRLSRIDLIKGRTTSSSARLEDLFVALQHRAFAGA